MPLRTYQQELAAQVVGALIAHDRVVMVLPTGAGKTRTAIEGILPHLPRPCVWVTHRRELLDQVNRLQPGLLIARTIQSFAKWESGFYSSIIIDEAHHSCADQYEPLLASNPQAKILALTATPYRLDGIGLGRCGFTKIVVGPDILELTQAGVLCPAVTYIPETQQRKDFRSWSSSAIAKCISTRSFNQAIVYCRTIGDCISTSRELEALGISSAHVESGMSNRSRQKIVNKIHAGKIRVVTNHSILTEGFDLPAADLIVLNRATESRSLWKQMIGRGLRTHPGKDACLILDTACNCFTHHSIYDAESFTLQGDLRWTSYRPEPITARWNYINQYHYSEGGTLIPWQDPRETINTIRSSLRRSSHSPLHRLLTGMSD